MLLLRVLGTRIGMRARAAWLAPPAAASPAGTAARPSLPRTAALPQPRASRGTHAQQGRSSLISSSSSTSSTSSTSSSSISSRRKKIASQAPQAVHRGLATAASAAGAGGGKSAGTEMASAALAAAGGGGSSPVEPPKSSLLLGAAAVAEEEEGWPAGSTFYCSPNIDRATHLRTDAAWLGLAARDPNSRVVPVLEGRSLLAGERAVAPPLSALAPGLLRQVHEYPWGPGAQGLSPGTPEGSGADASIMVLAFLGLEKGTGSAVFAMGLAQAQAQAQAQAPGAKEGAALMSPEGVLGDQTPELLPLPGALRWGDLRKEGPGLSAEEAGVLAYARGLLDWHLRNGFCSKCGGALAPGEAGHTRVCQGQPAPSAGPGSSNGAPAGADAAPAGSPSAASGCGNTVHPRLDPAVIMCVAYGDHVLLGRQSRWPQGRYSVLAGFVEVGEAFEEAVAREVEEEAGIPVQPSSIRYVATQPWPFPCSLMVGFSASAAPRPRPLPLRPVELRCGLTQPERQAVLGPQGEMPQTKPTEELEDSRWVHRDLVSALLAPEAGGMHWAAGSDSGPSKEARARAGAAAVGSGLFVPGPYAVANVLLRDWVRRRGQEEPAWAGDGVASAEIDTGVFKYILMRITEQSPAEGQDGSGSIIGSEPAAAAASAAPCTKLIVRGHKAASFHMNILERTRFQLAQLPLKVECLGGGRIEHNAEARTVHVYGHSQGFGQADHEVSAALIQRLYPLHQITTSDEGY